MKDTKIKRRASKRKFSLSLLHYYYYYYYYMYVIQKDCKCGNYGIAQFYI